MTGLPRRFAKMGFAKGWKAFRSYKGSRSSTAQKGGYEMAKRRRYGSHKRTSHRSAGMSGIAGNAVSVAIGGGSAAVYEKYVEPMIPVTDATTKSAIGVAAGLILASQSNKYMKSAGAGIAVVNAYQLIGGFMGGTTSAGSTATSIKVYS